VGGGDLGLQILRRGEAGVEALDQLRLVEVLADEHLVEVQA